MEWVNRHGQELVMLYNDIGLEAALLNPLMPRVEKLKICNSTVN